MNPLRLSARNYRTFESLELDLPSGCVAITGENGSGKSSLINLMDVALFAGRGELPPLLTLGEDELWLELEFEHGGEAYRVRRAHRKGKTTLDLERSDPGGDPFPWQPLTRETADQTQQLLEQILGLSRATFRASSFLAQGDGAAFTEASPRDRKAILAEILGLDIWDRLLDLARRDLRHAEDDVTGARARIQSLEVSLAGIGDPNAELVGAREVLGEAESWLRVQQAVLEEAREKLTANEGHAAHARSAQVALELARSLQEAARQDYARAVQAGVDREAKQAELDQAAQIASGIPLLEEQLVKARAAMELVQQANRLREQAESRDQARLQRVEQAAELRNLVAILNGKADHLETHIGDAGNCDRCGQTLGAEAAGRAAASYRTEAVQTESKLDAANSNAAVLAEAVDALRKQADELHAQVDETLTPPGTLESDLRLARAHAERRAALEVEVRRLAEANLQQDELAVGLADAADAVKKAEAEADAANELLVDVAELRSAVAAAERETAAAFEVADARRGDVARLEERAAFAEKITAELVDLQASTARQLRRVDLLKLAERAFGRDGIPALIVENAAIPQLELEANRILGELGGATAGCRIELRTQRLLKTTEALRETLDIVIVTPDGARPYETFSGGERTRLNLSLRIALARLLAHRRGADSRLLAIDEPDGLDAAGMDALATILQGLAGDFDKVLVVSHQPQLATSFDRTLTVTRNGNGSEVVT